MAVEIPVIVDIDGAFQEAAKRVSSAIRPLQREVDENTLSLNITVGQDDEGKAIKKTFKEIKAQGVSDMQELRTAIESVSQELIRLAASGDTDKFSNYLEAKVYFEDMMTAASRSRVEIDALAHTMQGLQARVQAARQSLNTTAIGSDEWKTAAKDLHLATEEAARYEQEIRRVGAESGNLQALNAALEGVRAKWQALGAESMYDPFGNLTAEAKAIQKEYASIAAQVDKQNAKLTEQYEKQREIERAAARAKEEEAARLAIIGRAATTMGEMSAKMNALQTELNNAEIGTPRWTALLGQIKQVAEETERVQRAMQNFGMEAGSLQRLNSKLSEIRQKFSAMGSTKLFDSSGNPTAELKAIQIEYAAVKNRIDKVTEALTAEYDAQRRSREESERKAAAARSLSEALALPVNSLSDLQAKLAAWQQQLNTAEIGSDKFTNAAVQAQVLSEAIAKVNAQIKILGSAPKSIDALSAKLQEINRQYNALSKADRAGAAGQKLLNDARALSKEIKEEAQTIDQILQKEQRRAEAIRKAKSARQYENAILNTTVKTMRVLQEKERILSDQLNRSEFGSKKYERLKKQVQDVRREIEEMNKDVAEQSANIDALLTKTNSKMANLVKRSAQLVALHSATRFIQNIREVTSQFEMQRVALAGILQDTAQAESLFRQVKAAALKSPFEIKDLVTFTKQLSAYRIETSKLFDVTMKLADVSAGLGVDMNRLVLAYGQVRAASVLRGQELRQFTEAGVPLVELLAEKFTKLNGRLTTTADVFELISKRAVPFAMIEEIFNDMTEAGGIFYKMQEKQSETLLGQWMKLKDALSIMYDEMGNTTLVHSMMEKLIADAMGLMQNWRLIAGSVRAVAYQFAALKLVSVFLPSLTRNVQLAKKAQDAYTRSLAASKMAAQTGSAAFARSAERFRKISVHLKAAANTTNILSQSWHRLAASMMSGAWIGVVSTALTALVGYLIAARQEAKRLGEELAENIGRGDAQIRQAERNFKRLADAAVKAADGSHEQREALEELKRTYGDIIPAQDLEIAKLREMKGDYNALTEAIRQKIEMQVHEQNLNQIEETQGKEMGKWQKNLQKYIKTLGLSAEEASRLIGSIADAVKEGALSSSMTELEQFYALVSVLMEKMTFNEGFSRNLAQSIIYRRSGFFQIDSDIVKLIKSYEGLNDKVEEEEARFAGLNNKLGKYSEAMKRIRAEVDKVPEGFTLDQVGTFEFEQARWKTAVDTYKRELKAAFAGIDISAAFNADDTINFDELVKHISNSKGTKELKLFVSEIQKDYLNIAPQENTTRLVTQAAIRFADELGIAMTRVQGRLKKDGQAMDEYAKSVEDFVKAQKLRVQTIEFEQKHWRYGVSNYPRPTDQDIANEKQELSFLEKMLEFVKEFLKQKSTGGTGQDPWIILYKNRMKFMQDFQKGVEDLDKYLLHESSLAKEQGIMKGRGLSLGIDVSGLKGDADDLRKWYEGAIDDVVAKIRSMGGKEFAGLGVTAILAKDLTGRKMQKYQELLQELWKGLTDFNIDQMKKDLEKNLDKLAEDVKRSESAKNFYQDILGLTGDQALAATLTMEIYGTAGDDFKKRIQDELKGTFDAIELTPEESAKITDEIRDAIGSADIKTLMKNYDSLPPKVQAAVKRAAEATEKYNSDVLKSYYKLLNKYNEISQQRIDIERNAAEKIKTINEGLALEKQANAGKENEESLNAAAEARAGVARAAVNRETELELFKLTKDYRLFFNTVGVLSVESARKVAAAQKKMLTDMFTRGEISLTRYKRELSEIESQLKKYTNNQSLTWTYLSGGIDAVIDKLHEYSEGILGLASTMELSDFGHYVPSEDEKAYFEKMKDELNAVLNKGDFTTLFKKKDVTATITVKVNKAAQDAYQKALNEGKSEAEAAAEAAAAASEALADVGNELSSAAADFAGGVAQFEQIFYAVSNMIEFAEKMEELEKKQYGPSIWQSTYFLEGIFALNKGLTKSYEAFKSGNIFEAFYQLGEGIYGLINPTQKWDDEIERQSNTIDKLDYQYGRLEKSIQNAFGSDYVTNYNQQLDTLYAKQEAYLKQAEAERGKEKNRDYEKIKSYEKAARDVADQIADMQSQLAEFFAGTDLTSAAKDFANAWIEAYKEFGSVTTAMQEKFQDMVQNMVENSLAAKIMQEILGPVFDEIDRLAKEGGELSAADIAQIATMANAVIPNINEAMTTLMNTLTASGYNIRQQPGQFTGISRNIANATEESINGLAAGINTQNFYMSYMPTISANVAAILMHLTGGEAYANGEMPVTPMNSEMMMHMSNLDANLAALLSAVKSVITGNGAATNTHYIAVR